MKSLTEIEQVVCDVFGVTSEFIHEKSRAENRPYYRYIIAYISKKVNYKFVTLKSIGDYFGNKHDTIYQGVANISDEITVNRVLRENINECLKKLMK